MVVSKLIQISKKGHIFSAYPNAHGSHFVVLRISTGRFCPTIQGISRALGQSCEQSYDCPNGSHEIV